MFQGNLGWALMQQNNYVEAEDAYRRALVIAADNNKMCNLGICLMKQGRIGEAKDTLRRVKPAVADGPRGVDSHLKAYERAQQMLRDLESEMMNKGLDRIEQRKLFDAFLGSSAIWQPQPCRELNVAAAAPISSVVRLPPQDDFADENVNNHSNIIANHHPTRLPLGQKMDKQILAHPFGNSLNIAAPPFYSSKFVNEPAPPPMSTNHLTERLKRTRSGNAAMYNKGNKDIGDSWKPSITETRSQPNSPNWRDMLPDSKDFEDAILAAVLGSSNEESGNLDQLISNNNGGDEAAGAGAGKVVEKKIDKRLKVFRDLAPSLSPRA